LNFFKNLRMQVYCLFNSIMSLCWALMLLFLVIYLFSIVFVQASVFFIRTENIGATPTPNTTTISSAHVDSYSGDDMGPAQIQDGIATHFPTVIRGMLTLIMCVTGGMEWYEPVQVLLNVSWIYALAFLGFVVLTLFGFLNVLAAVNVQHALTVTDRELIIQSEMRSSDTFLSDMSDLFAEADADCNRAMTRSEFEAYLKNDRVMMYLAGHQLDVSDVSALFEMLDVDDTGTVELEEFVLGIMRLKGQARCLDVFRLFYCLNQLKGQLDGIQKTLGTQANGPGAVSQSHHLDHEP